MLTPCPLCAGTVHRHLTSAWWLCSCGAWMNFHTRELVLHDLPVAWPR